MRVHEALRMLAQPGVVGDELPRTLDATLMEAQLGRVEHWPEHGRAAVLLDDLWGAEGDDATSAALLVDGVTSVEVDPRVTPFVGGTMHFTVGLAEVRSRGREVTLLLGEMSGGGDVRLAGARALLVMLADRSDRSDDPPSLVDDLQGYLDWSLDLDREVDVLGWYEVRPER